MERGDVRRDWWGEYERGLLERGELPYWCGFESSLLKGGVLDNGEPSEGLRLPELEREREEPRL